MMDKEEFLALLSFPEQWKTLDMYPEELFEIQVSEYRSGHEESSEHTRNGAFHWWLCRVSNKKMLSHLACLATMDPDPMLARDIKKYIEKSSFYDEDIKIILEEIDWPSPHR